MSFRPCYPSPERKADIPLQRCFRERAQARPPLQRQIRIKPLKGNQPMGVKKLKITQFKNWLRNRAITVEHFIYLFILFSSLDRLISSCNRTIYCVQSNIEIQTFRMKNSL